MVAPFDLRSFIQLPVLEVTVFSNIPPPVSSHGSLAGLIIMSSPCPPMLMPLSLFHLADALKQYLNLMYTAIFWFQWLQSRCID